MAMSFHWQELFTARFLKMPNIRQMSTSLTKLKYLFFIDISYCMYGLDQAVINTIIHNYNISGIMNILFRVKNRQVQSKFGNFAYFVYLFVKLKPYTLWKVSGECSHHTVMLTFTFTEERNIHQKNNNHITGFFSSAAFPEINTSIFPKF